MKKLFVLFILTTLTSFGQEVKKFTYPNGQPKAEATFDKNGVYIKTTQWDEYGNLLYTQNFQTMYKDYPKKDFSKIKWASITDGVGIYKFNKKDTNVVVKDSSFITFNYHCYTINGQMYDNTFDRGCPIQTKLNDMIKGFVLAVKQMKPGETALIKIEPNMGYGDKPAGNVPANSTLVYLVSLISAD